MKRFILFITLIGALVWGGGMLAQPEHRGPKKSRGEHMAKMLDLSEEQQSKIIDLQLKLQKELIPLRSKMESLKGELKLAQTAEQFDQAKVDKLLNEMQSVRTQIQSKRIQHQQQVRSLLTAEQRKKFDAHLLRMGDGPRNFGEHRGERHRKEHKGQDRDE